MSEMSEQVLKPCPFCGGAPVMKPAPHKRPYGSNGFTIRCDSCNVQRTQRTIRQSLEWLEAEMTRDWNTRLVLAHAAQPSVPTFPDHLRDCAAFVVECSKLSGGMVNGNLLSAKATLVLPKFSAPAPPSPAPHEPSMFDMWSAGDAK